MKKIGALLLTFILFLSFSVACTTKNKTTKNTGVDAEKPKILTSFYVMSDLAQKIGQDKISIENLVPEGQEPHDWEPSPLDMKKLENADMLIYNGAGMEHWVDKVITTLENQDLILVEASKGIDLLEGHHHHHDEHGDEDHGHEHGDDEHEHGDDEHEHEHDDEDHDHDTIFDPHVWLNPLYALQEMQVIKDALCKLDPANKEFYEKNYQTYEKSFKDLDEKFKTALAPIENKTIVVSHEAFGYLCQAYDMTQLGIEGLSAESEPDPAQMKEIIEFVKENHVTTIFFEELLSPKTAEIIATETGANTAMLNPLEGLNSEDLKNGADYISVMEKNLDALLEAFKK